METIWLQPKYGIKKITGPRINKELSAGLNGSVSVSRHCHDRRVKGFDSPYFHDIDFIVSRDLYLVSRCISTGGSRNKSLSR